MFQRQEGDSGSLFPTVFSTDPGVQKAFKDASLSTFSDLSANLSSVNQCRISDLESDLSEEQEASLPAKAKSV